MKINKLALYENKLALYENENKLTLI